MNARVALHQRLLVGCVVVLGVGVRLLDWGDPPLDFHPIRQFQGALIARHFYYLLGGASSALGRAANDAMLSFHEPPINEMIGAGIMRLFGHESLAVLRGIAVVEYLLAAVVLYVILRRLASAAGQVAGLAVFLLLPFGISASRAFLPDILMLVFAELTLLAALRHARERSPASMAMLALAAAAAMFVKVQAGPLLLPLIAWSVWVLRDHRSSLALGSLMALASALPALVWIALTGIPDDATFFVFLLVTPGFYVSWTLQMVEIVGPGLLVVVLALSLPRSAGAGVVPLRLCAAGYLLYTIFFDYRVETHGYYSLFLVPMAAVCVAVVISHVEYPGRRVLLPLATGNIWALVVITVFIPLAPFSYLAHSNNGATVARYSHIGSMVGGSTFILLSSGLGSGDVAGYYTGDRVIDWPGQLDLTLDRLAGHKPISAADRLASMVSSQVRWMVVINHEELDAQPDLQAVLAGYRLVRYGDVATYDLNSRVPKPPRPASGLRALERP